jgi:hypothetical protein
MVQRRYLDFLQNVLGELEDVGTFSHTTRYVQSMDK